jgi:hypothetical protein
MRDVWDEFFLARLLREHGTAEVDCLRIPPLNGRRRTLAQAGDVEWEVVSPPRDLQEAARRADQAGRRARELDAERKALPRKRASPKLEAAAKFVCQHKITSLTKEVLKKAHRKGISKDALRRALGRKSA